MKFRSKAFVILCILVALYASVNLIASPPRDSLRNYHVSTAKQRLINATVVVPVVTVWFVGLSGYQTLKRYSRYVAKNREGIYVTSLSRGITTLAFWLPVSATISSVLSFVTIHHPSLFATVIILSGYISLLFPLVGFWYINKACRGLGNMAKQPLSQLQIHSLAFILIVSGVTYGYLIASAHDEIHHIYHMPVVVVLLTLAIPYIFSWYLGLLAVFDLHRYSRTVKGIIFRKSWNRLAFGINSLVLLSIILQYALAVSAKLANVRLIWLLTLIYSVIALMGISYSYIALGARRLIKIEEV